VVYAVYCDDRGSYITSQSMSAMVSACEGTALPHHAFGLFKTVSIFCLLLYAVLLSCL